MCQDHLALGLVVGGCVRVWGCQSLVPSLLAFHTVQVTPSTDLRSSSHPPVQHLVCVHDFLTAHGAVVVPPV
eukprot:1624922-Rhodomonas_salina.1